MTDIRNGKPRYRPSPRPCLECGGPKRRGQGRRWCDDCLAERIRTAPETRRAKARTYSLRWKYGITAEQYDILFARQEHRCGVCGVAAGPEQVRERSFQVDHNHETGLVRGLLCRRCNAGLGYLEGRKGWLAQAQHYLETSLELPADRGITHSASRLRGDRIRDEASAVGVLRPKQHFVRATHCAYGHLWDEANTGTYTNGKRRCRACDRRRHVESKHRQQDLAERMRDTPTERT